MAGGFGDWVRAAEEFDGSLWIAMRLAGLHHIVDWKWEWERER